MKILIFGGSFSPPTKAHEQIIKFGLANFDQVWAMPSNDRDDKSMSAAPKYRLAMLGLVKRHAFNSNPRLKISRLELNLGIPSKTYKTVAELERKFPNHEFWFAYGEDSYDDMANWEYGKRLKQTMKILLFTRGQKLKELGTNVTVAKVKIDQASSSEVRERIKSKRPVGIINKAVGDYIKSNRLFIS